MFDFEFDPVLTAWGIVVRLGQALLDAGPTLLCGVLVAGIFSQMLGPQGTARLFGVGARSGVLRAWFWGMMLPVCSLGVFPVIRELRRAGVSGGTILAFALTGPLFNPLSLLYGLTLSEPIVIISFAFLSLVMVSVAGVVFDWVFPGTGLPVPAASTLPAPGLKRLLAVAVAAGRDLAGLSLLVVFVPFGSMEHSMRHDDPWSPLIMVLIAAPAYESPMRAMMHLGLLFDHGNSVGAALVLLILGAGVNLGLVVWSLRTFGLKLTAGWFVLVLAIVLGFAYGVNRPLDFAVNRESHTPAFDDFATPFPPGTTHAAVTGLVEGKLLDRAGAQELVGLLGVAGLLLLGLATRLIDRAVARWQRGTESWSVIGWLQRTSSRPEWDWVIPSKVLAGIVLVGLVALSIVGCYVYYAPPKELFEEMQMVRAEVQYCVLKANKDQALRVLPRLDDLTRKLQVSVFLRTGQYDAAAAEKAEALREKLEALRDAFRLGTFAEKSAEEWNREVYQAWREFRAAYDEVVP